MSSTLGIFSLEFVPRYRYPKTRVSLRSLKDSCKCYVKKLNDIAMAFLKGSEGEHIREGHCAPSTPWGTHRSPERRRAAVTVSGYLTERKNAKERDDQKVTAQSKYIEGSPISGRQDFVGVTTGASNIVPSEIRKKEEEEEEEEEEEKKEDEEEKEGKSKANELEGTNMENGLVLTQRRSISIGRNVAQEKDTRSTICKRKKEKDR
ncbi:hypothetical protein HZH66_001453 [Vespula vulgaris]|uniref:Uncharacterized protein n=1 Tax=Vespula vulgaris TaxID=7454 RepID=A0A834KV22_VESVU|nr:hypothetical protein HZH66_001453 [Vespula vulgaris]